MCIVMHPINKLLCYIGKYIQLPHLVCSGKTVIMEFLHGDGI